jgi:N-acetylglucosamine kinase-like BadF-type ATPase
VAVDLGGSWLRVIARRPGRGRYGRGRGLVGPALPLRALRLRLGRAWRAWRVRPGDVGALVVSTRGVWTPAERRTATRRLRLLARRVHVLPDAEAAYLGALGERPGVLLLAGTGAIALARDRRGRFARAGGLGPLLGDDGSAFWIGREWLRTRIAGTARRRERAAATARSLAIGPQPVVRIAGLAPAILRRAGAGDALARQVVARAQAALAALVVSAARTLSVPLPVTVSWAGGLLADPVFRAGVWRAARRQGLRLRPHPPAAPALTAALALAERLARGGPEPGRPGAHSPPAGRERRRSAARRPR